MKLGNAEIDVVKSEQGDWVDEIPEMDDLRLKVRGIGNANFRQLQSTLLLGVPRHKRVGGRIDTPTQDAITAKCLLNTVLLDWDGLTDDSGKPITYSRDEAEKLLTKPEYRRFHDAVVWAATVVAEKRATDQEDATKN